MCNHTAGPCPSFCAGVDWTGSCCRQDAVGNLSAPECEGRGCADNHCCVKDELDEEGILRVPDAGPLPEDPRTPEQRRGFPSLKHLNDLFEKGRPSNDLEEAGLVVHCADGTERQEAPWLPCQANCGGCNGCSQFSHFWSTSIISRKMHRTFGPVGLILSPKQNEVLCAYPWDAGTMTQGCARTAQTGSGPNFRYRGDQLADMLGLAESWHLTNLYNEVLVSSPTYVNNTPTSVAAFVIGLNGDQEHFQPKWAYSAYAQMLKGLKESDPRPLLLRFNSSAPAGHVLTDESAHARGYLRAKPSAEHEPLPSSWHENQPFRDGAKPLQNPESGLVDELSKRGPDPEFDEQLARTNALPPGVPRNR